MGQVDFMGFSTDVNNVINDVLLSMFFEISNFEHLSMSFYVKDVMPSGLRRDDHTFKSRKQTSLLNRLHTPCTVTGSYKSKNDDAQIAAQAPPYR